MDVTLQFFDGCPNWRQAEAVVCQALGKLGLTDHPVTLQRVESPEEAERLSFRGSPTVLVNGEDPFAEPGAPVGLMCRVYSTDTGLARLPTLEQVTSAFRSRM